MELRQLEYLAAVVSHGSFGRAAQEIYVTQSALSQQIARLEDELGTALLHRSARGVRPTPAGVEFLDHARAILGRVSEARAAVDEHREAVRGVARVAATAYDSHGLPEALIAFHRAHPGVQLALQHASAAQVVEQLAAGSIDVGLLAVHDGGPRLAAGIEVHTIAEQPLRVLAAAGDPLARPGQAATIDDLRGRPVILPERGTALRGLLDDAFAGAGFSPVPLFETSDPGTILALVSAGLGLSIVPAGWLRADAPGVAWVALAARLAPYRIALLAASEPRVPARDRLVEHLLEALS